MKKIKVTVAGTITGDEDDPNLRQLIELARQCGLAVTVAEAANGSKFANVPPRSSDGLPGTISIGDGRHVTMA